jgi:hypothetical protein
MVAQSRPTLGEGSVRANWFNRKFLLSELGSFGGLLLLFRLWNGAWMDGWSVAASAVGWFITGAAIAKYHAGRLVNRRAFRVDE